MTVPGWLLAFLVAAGIGCIVWGEVRLGWALLAFAALIGVLEDL